MVDWRFEVGRSYNRRDIHDALGGQRQGGISTPSGKPVILLFTGEQGREFGYSDGWTDEGLYRYTGQGQRGDMEFIRGNKALRDHTENGKTVHLFETLRGGRRRYVGEMAVVDWDDQTQLPDVSGAIRSGIVFKLIPVYGEETTSAESEDLGGLSLVELRRRAIEGSASLRAPRNARAQYRYRSAAVAQYAKARADGKCEACGRDAPFLKESGEPFLECHHLTRVADDGPDRPESVAGLCPNCHRRAHHGADRDDFNERLNSLILERESQSG